MRGYRAWVLAPEDHGAIQSMMVREAGARGEGAASGIIERVQTGVLRREVMLSSCHSLEDVFATMNGAGAGYPPGYRGRSLSVGDIVWDPEGRGWLCAAIGWQGLSGLRLPENGRDPVPDIDRPRELQRERGQPGGARGLEPDPFER